MPKVMVYPVLKASDLVILYIKNMRPSFAICQKKKRLTCSRLKLFSDTYFLFFNSQFQTLYENARLCYQTCDKYLYYQGF